MFERALTFRAILALTQTSSSFLELKPLSISKFLMSQAK